MTLCPNIGPAQRRWRLIAGIVMTGAAVLLLAVLISTGAPRFARVALFLPILAAAILFLQVRERTCIALAARGLQQMDRGIEPVTDIAALGAMQRQARRIRYRALLGAALVTALATVVP